MLMTEKQGIALGIKKVSGTWQYSFGIYTFVQNWIPKVRFLNGRLLNLIIFDWLWLYFEIKVRKQNP